MPPRTFQEELRELRDNLSHASSLIDSTRRFGMPSSTISSLQASLASNVRAIDNAFNRYRSDYGSAFERGDSIAAEAIHSCNGLMQLIVANSHRLRPRHELENEEGISDGRDLDDRYNGIERDVLAAFEGLARRLGGGRGGLGGGGGGGGRGLLAQLQGLSSFGGLGSRDTNERGSEGDTVVPRRDLSLMVQHLRDSWMVETVAGRTVYVNVYEPSLRRSDRPRTGFIQVESDRGLGMGLGGWRGRFDGTEGIGRGPLGLALGSRSGGSIFDR